MTRYAAAVTPSTPISDDSKWREQLLAVICVAIAAVLLIAPFTYWAVDATPPRVFGLALAVGLLILPLPFIRFLSLGVRSWIYCVALSVVVTAIGFQYGFAPVPVTAYNVLLLTSGLLLGKRAMILVSVIGVGAFVVAGIAVDAGAYVIDRADRDPGELQHWIRTSVMFGLLSLTIVAIVRFATRTVNEQFARVTGELARARALRKAAEEARETRIARERQLRDAQKLHAVASLSGGLAHLFNNALTVVRAVVDSLQKDTSESSRARATSRLTEAIEPAVRATRDLMIFSRRESYETQSVELGPLLAEFGETLGQTVPEDVNLRFNTPPGLTVRVDPGSLKQLLLNLVLNAADATGVTGNVQITVAPFKEEHEPDVKWAVIAVEDDGSGMDEAQLRQALDPFRSSKSEHSGLGLPVAHAIATQAGGELRLESSKGVGTRVLVLLPIETARDSYDPELLWPIASALHGAKRLGAIDVPPSAEDWIDEPTQEPAWQDAVTRRLGRITAIIIFSLLIVVSVLVPHMRPLLFTVAPVSIALLATAGWARGLSGSAARTCLIGGFWMIGAAVVFRAGFDNMAGMSIILIAIAWAGLLGGRWDGLAVVLLTVVSFLVFGALRSGAIYYPPASNSDMNVAANWFRFAPQFGLYSLVLSTSVLGALGAVRRGAESEQRALRSVEEMRRREADEGARMLALETNEARSERAASAGQAAGTVAHDLLNAVQALVGSVELLAADKKSEDQLNDLIGRLAHATGYAEALTTQFDSISPTQDTGCHYPVCNVSQMITTMAELMQSVLPDRIELVADVEPELLVRISETDLRRLVFNLIANGRDAINGTGTIAVSLYSHDDTISLRVSDTGCGMDDATIAQMFDPFFSTKERGQGTGLGLHSVDDVVRRTRGSIDVESTLGVGTSIVVTWPIEAHARMSQEQPLTEHEQTRAEGGTVLLAEDQALVRQVMAEAIRGAGFDVVEASDGDEGKRLALREDDYVAACIDGVMPGAPSSEVIECFQQNHPGRPVLLCSGYMPGELADRGLLNPGVTLLAKPFAPSRLQEELRAAIEQSS